jgi:hypothetical protein
LAGTIVDQIVAGFNSVLDFVSRIITWLTEEITSIVNSFGPGGDQNIIQAAMDIGIALVNRIIDGITSKFGAVWGAIARVLNDALEAVGLPRLFPEPEDEDNPGTRLVMSIVAGITENANLIEDALVAAVSTAMFAAQSVLNVGFSDISIAAAASMPSMPTLPPIAPVPVGGGGGINNSFQTTITSQLDEEEFYYRVQEAMRS